MTKQPRYATAVLTGASAGIGAALARVLAPHCRHLVLVARRESLLRELAEELSCDVRVVAADISDDEGYPRLLNAALADLPACDLVILNAGMSVHVPLDQPQLTATKTLYAVNLFGAIATLDVVLPAMIAQNRGHIVGVSSVAGYRGLPGAAAYCSSKAALWRFLESVRCDLARTKLRVSTHHPGFVDTAMTRKNRFPMPFMIDDARAARSMLRAILRGKRHHAFPLVYRLLFMLLRPLPDALFFRLFQLFPRRQ